MPANPPDRPVYADRLLKRSDLRRLPTPKPLIANVLDQGTTALLYGRWSTAKTFIAIDWAASVATGLDWMGRPVQPDRRVLYVAAEGGTHSFDGRLSAWESAHDSAIPDDVLHLYPHPVNLMFRTQVDNLAAVIAWGGYDLVVLDTLARCMVGADENGAKDPGLVIDAMTRLLAQTRDQLGVVLGVHHAGKDGRTLRGSSAFEAGVDTVYRTERDGGVIKLDRQKRRDGPEFDRHQLLIESVPGTTSATIFAHQGVGKASRDEQLLPIFDAHFPSGEAKQADVRKAWTAAGHPNTNFDRAVNDLVEQGWIVKVGNEKRPNLKRVSK